MQCNSRLSLILFLIFLCLTGCSGMMGHVVEYTPPEHANKADVVIDVIDSYKGQEFTTIYIEERESCDATPTLKRVAEFKNNMLNKGEHQKHVRLQAKQPLNFLTKTTTWGVNYKVSCYERVQTILEPNQNYQFELRSRGQPEMGRNAKPLKCHLVFFTRDKQGKKQKVSTKKSDYAQCAMP